MRRPILYILYFIFAITKVKKKKIEQIGNPFYLLNKRRKKKKEGKKKIKSLIWGMLLCHLIHPMVTQRHRVTRRDITGYLVCDQGD